LAVRASGMTSLVHDIEETARLLGVCRATVENLLARGDIPYLKIGSRTLIARATLESFVQAREHYREGRERGGVRCAEGVGQHPEGILAGEDASGRSPDEVAHRNLRQGA
jgi:excisionase family DNA binding protein